MCRETVPIVCCMDQTTLYNSDFGVSYLAFLGFQIYYHEVKDGFFLEYICFISTLRRLSWLLLECIIQNLVTIYTLIHDYQDI